MELRRGWVTLLIMIMIINLNSLNDHVSHYVSVYALNQRTAIENVEYLQPSQAFYLWGFLFSKIHCFLSICLVQYPLSFSPCADKY